MAPLSVSISVDRFLPCASPFPMAAVKMAARRSLGGVLSGLRSVELHDVRGRVAVARPPHHPPGSAVTRNLF